METFCHVAIIFAQKPATPSRFLDQEASNVRTAIYLANGLAFSLYLCIQSERKIQNYQIALIGSLCCCTGEGSFMSTSLSPKMSSWRLSALQGADKEIVSLWCYGSCFWVLVLQYLVWKGTDSCPFLWWTLSQVIPFTFLLLFF